MSKIYKAAEVKAAYVSKNSPDNAANYNTCIVNGSNAWQYRTYLQHDLSGIPCGSKIISAKLYVYVLEGNNMVENAKHKFDAVITEWEENTLTWNNQPISADTPIPDEWHGAPTIGAWNNWDITEFVQKWVYQVMPNNGLRFVNYDESSYQTNWKLYNRRQAEEYATYIEIEYEPVEQWCISHERMVELADAIRAKKNTTAIFTPAQMVAEIEGIVTGNDLPNAEDAFFGTASNEVEYGILSETLSSGSSVGSDRGYRFTMSSTMACYGIRAKFHSAASYDTYLRLWDAETQTIIASGTIIGNIKDEWIEHRFTAPINLLAEKTYVVTVHQGNIKYAASGSVAFNPKLTNVQWVTAELAGAYPTKSMNSPYCVDIIIGEPLVESIVEEYKIQTATMTDIADEIKRITGADGTLSTAQIITALEAQKAISQFPSIPADVYAQYPYAWCSETASGNKWCWVSSAPWFVNDSSCASTGNIQWYKAVDGAWTLNNTTSNTSYYLPTYPIAWSNRNIPNGSVSATDIYFTASPILV